nr:hypothetical protein [Tanacetum cinerariifolium]
HKYHADGSLSWYKARLVTNGCSQQIGVDWSDMFSPVVKLDTIRTVLSLDLLRGWLVHQLDFKNAFLNASSTALVQCIISSLHQEFDMIDFGPLNYFLGISVTRDSTVVRICIDKFVVVFHCKYSRVFGKILCVQQGTALRGSSPFFGGVGDGLDKCRLQPSRYSDVFEAYLALRSSGAGSRCSRSVSQITPVFNSNLVHSNFSSLCGPSASLSGRSFHENTNVVIITGHKCASTSRVNSSVGVQSASRKTRRRVLTSGSIADTNSVASPGTSYTYSDLGDCNRRCRYCGASFCYVENLKGHSHNQTPQYHICCGGGRICIKD